MIDRQKLSNKLTESFIDYQWRLDNPMPYPMVTKDDIYLKYRSDPCFHAKVSSLVGAVMHAVDGAEEI